MNEKDLLSVTAACHIKERITGSRPMSLAAKDRVALTPDDIALADERQELSWLQLDRMLNRVVNRIRDYRLSDDRRIAIFAHNSVETAVAYLGSLLAGVSFVPISYHLTVDELVYILKESGARLVLAGPETVDTALRAGAIAGVDMVVGWRAPPEGGMESWDDWIAQGSDAEPPTDLVPRPQLHFTSGTTGRPKAVETPPTVFPYLANMAELAEFQKRRAARTGLISPGLIVSPMYHAGPIASVRAVIGGVSMVILSRFDAEKTLAAIDRYRVRSTMMVPTQFLRLLSLPQGTRAKYDVSSLVQVTHTGAACPPDVKRRMIDWFGRVLTELYGATEAGTTNMITSDEWLRKPGSVGRTIKPYEVVVMDEEGRICGPNEEGILHFRDGTGRGVVYHCRAGANGSTGSGTGIFTLGDIGYVDDDGYVFITDRASDMIVSGGVNIYPAEIERELIAYPGVADIAVIGVPNAEMGEEVKALIVPTDADSPPTEADLDTFCRERLAGYKCPRSFEFRSDIGRNDLGKVNKRSLRRPYWGSDRTIGG